jgi:hypothetical protein
MVTRFILLLIVVNANFCLAQNCLDEILQKKLYSNFNNVINGRKWINEKKYLGSPLLIEKYWPEADISFNGFHYSGQVMNYDVNKDEMIIYNSEKGKVKFVVIDKEKLSGFSFTDTIENKKHIYEYKELAGIKGKALYENVSAGKVLLYIKPVKKVEIRSAGKSMGQFYDYYEYFVNPGDGFSRITSNGELIKLLLDHNTELQRYIRDNKIKINNQHPEIIIGVIRYFNGLN